MTVVWVDCRCFLSFVFLGGARRLELSPCNTVCAAINDDVSLMPCHGVRGCLEFTSC